MTESKGPDIDFIEVIEPVLDNGMAVIVLVGGFVLGLIAFYAWLEWQRQEPSMRPRLVAMDDDDEEDDTVYATDG